MHFSVPPSQNWVPLSPACRLLTMALAEQQQTGKEQSSLCQVKRAKDAGDAQASLTMCCAL